MLEVVDLEFPKEGFSQFISAWIIEFAERCFVVDPGPSASLEVLYRALKGRSPDYVLLTHIHVDHAGGIGAFLQHFPDAKVVVLDAAAAHLIDPSRLIEGSKKTLGSLMDLYGEVAPVAPERIVPTSTLAEVVPAVECIPTPGHAAHHVSYLLGNALFCGEALGVRYQLNEREVYFRPATPKRFVADSYRASVARLEARCRKAMAQGAQPLLCFAHYGSETEALKYCQKADEQIDIWIEQVVLLLDDLGERLLADTAKYLEEFIIRVSEVDPDFALFEKLPKDIASRERIFIHNTFEGIVDEVSRGGGGF